MLSTADVSLILSAAALGAAGAWHCAAMCGSLCSAASQCNASRVIPIAALADPVDPVAHRRLMWAAFLGARSVSYALAGALVAAVGGWLGSSQGVSGLVRMVWAMTHALALVYGLYLLTTGRQPPWLTAWSPGSVHWPGAWRRWAQGRWAAAGLLWVLLPCGLLQSALLLGTLASGPVAGGLMLWVFAIASTPGLLAWPLVEQWMRGRGSAARAEPLRAALMRTSGALLALAAGWSLFHGIWKGSPEVC